MSVAELRDTFVGNTVVAELPEGTAYDLVQPGGAHIGLHPKLGKLEGSWKIDSKGEACVTWHYDTRTIENCGTVVDLGDSAYQWGDQKLTLQRGDIKQLGE
jgi:hypothetical protein